MKRPLAIAAVTLAASAVLAAPERPWFPETFQLPPYGVVHHSSRCEPGRPVQAVAMGSGASPLGIYVFNAAGQCVAWDDDIHGNLVDDRIVSWMPTDVGRYELEIRNLGPAGNLVEAVFKGAGGEK